MCPPLVFTVVGYCFKIGLVPPLMFNLCSYDTSGPKLLGELLWNKIPPTGLICYWVSHTVQYMRHLAKEEQNGDGNCSMHTLSLASVFLGGGKEFLSGDSLPEPTLCRLLPGAEWHRRKKNKQSLQSMPVSSCKHIMVKFIWWSSFLSCTFVEYLQAKFSFYRIGDFD